MRGRKEGTRVVRGRKGARRQRCGSARLRGRGDPVYHPPWCACGGRGASRAELTGASASATGPRSVRRTTQVAPARTSGFPRGFEGERVAPHPWAHVGGARGKRTPPVATAHAGAVRRGHPSVRAGGADAEGSAWRAAPLGGHAVPQPRNAALHEAGARRRGRAALQSAVIASECTEPAVKPTTLRFASATNSFGLGWFAVSPWPS